MEDAMKTMIGVMLAPLALLPVQALAQDAVSAPISQFMDGFNKGDVAAARATHLPDPVIIDEVSPHIWRGTGAFDAWVADLMKDSAAQGITDQSVELGTPTRTLVTGDSAYVIVPSTYRFKQKGTAMSEVAQMTFALRKTAAGWKIAAWTWTGPNATPVK
jgi:ketosteroid isomerase-like protein